MDYRSFMGLLLILIALLLIICSWGHTAPYDEQDFYMDAYEYAHTDNEVAGEVPE